MANIYFSLILTKILEKIFYPYYNHECNNLWWFGFLGEQLANKLNYLGHNVTIFDRKKKSLSNKIKFISGDILNKKDVEKLC